MDWLLPASTLAVALVAVVVAVGQRSRLRRAEGAVEAVRRAMPAGEAGASPEAGVRRLVDQAAGCAEQLQVMELALDSSPLGLLLLDRSLSVTYASSAARAMVEGTAEGQVAMSRVRAAAAGVLAAGEPADERIEVLGRRRRVLRLLATPQPGRPAPGVVAHLLDVTDREQVDAIRRDFVANVSHELKTPVGALAVLAEALADDADDELTRKRLARRVQAEAGRMTALVNDLIDLSQVEAGEPDVAPVEVAEVVGEAVRRVGVLADAAGVTVRVERPATPLTVSADRRQLVTAVANLLDNAVAHSFPGPESSEVAVRARRSGPEAVIEVEDHGVGIPADEHDRIFERFYRVDRGRSRQRGGTGLGLAIVRHVALSHGGAVEVDSEPGAGATFRLRLPLETG